jgi:hypothetical protein
MVLPSSLDDAKRLERAKETLLPFYKKAFTRKGGPVDKSKPATLWLNPFYHESPVKFGDAETTKYKNAKKKGSVIMKKVNGVDKEFYHWTAVVYLSERIPNKDGTTTQKNTRWNFDKDILAKPDYVYNLAACISVERVTQARKLSMKLTAMTLYILGEYEDAAHGDNVDLSYLSDEEFEPAKMIQTSSQESEPAGDARGEHGIKSDNENGGASVDSEGRPSVSSLLPPK